MSRSGATEAVRPESPVSVVVPAKNNAATIGATLRSLLAEPEVAEILVVLAPSSDGTETAIAALEDARIRRLDDPGTGISKAMNIGIAAATGRFFAKVDADDLVPPGRFAWQVALLDARPDIVAVAGSYRSIDDAGAPITAYATTLREGALTEEYRRGETRTHFGAFLCRMDVLREIGGFREWFVVAEDLDLPFRLAHAGEIWFCPREAYVYRLRSSSITHSHNVAYNKFFDDHARIFARQRGERGRDDLDDGRAPTPPRREGTMLTAGRVDARAQAAGHLEGAAWRAFEAGRNGESVRLILRSMKTRPTPKRLRSLVSLLARMALGARRGARAGRNAR